MNQNTSKVMILCDYFAPATRAGGPIRSLLPIVQTEAEHFDITILTNDFDMGDKHPFDRALTDEIDHSLPEVTIRRVGFSGRFRRLAHLIKSSGPVELIYLNSIFSPAFAILPISLAAARILPRTRFLIAPRGELGRGPLQHKPRKKRAAAWVILNLLRRVETVWHASSLNEAEDIRRFTGNTQSRITVRVNPAPAPEAGPFLEPYEQFTVAFVARMTPSKNFLLLAKAAAKAAHPIRILAIGPTEDLSYWEKCKKQLASAPAYVTVETLGHLSNEEVRRTLRRCHAFVSPTRGENFGHAIAEALSVGCPVMVTDSTLWTDIIRRGAGTIIDGDDCSQLVDALSAQYQAVPSELQRQRTLTRGLYREWWSATQGAPESFFQHVLGIDR